MACRTVFNKRPRAGRPTRPIKMKLRTCPNCGSSDITLDRLMGITGTRYRCNTCGYTGDVIVEQDVDKKFKR